MSGSFLFVLGADSSQSIEKECGACRAAPCQPLPFISSLPPSPVSYTPRPQSRVAQCRPPLPPLRHSHSSVDPPLMGRVPASANAEPAPPVHLADWLLLPQPRAFNGEGPVWRDSTARVCAWKSEQRRGNGEYVGTRSGPRHHEVKKAAKTTSPHSDMQKQQKDLENRNTIILTHFQSFVI